MFYMDSELNDGASQAAARVGMTIYRNRLRTMARSVSLCTPDMQVPPVATYSQTAAIMSAFLMLGG